MSRSTRRVLVAGVLTLVALTGAVTLDRIPASADESVRPTGDRVFQLSGLGYGHGHGLSQYGAYGAATQGVSASAILDFYYPGTATARTSRTSIKVLITDDDVDLRVLPDAGLSVTDESTGRAAVLPTGMGVQQWRALRSGAGIGLQYTVDGTAWTSWAMPGGSAVLAGPVSFAGPEIVRTVVPAGTRGYRGELRAVVSGSGLHTVNVLGLDDYLRGVVPRESPSSWPAAALQAQAVAARSYAVYAIEHRSSSQYHDVCDTTACQVYSGARSYTGSTVTDLEPASTDAAIAATALQVRTYGGATVFAQFSAANGGWTAAGSQPYLAAEEDPWDGITGSAAHSWTTTVAAATLEAAYPSIGRLVDLRVSARNGDGTWGGRVTAVVLTGTTGSVTLTGETFRSVTGIKSTWFLVYNAATTIAGRYAADDAWRAQLGEPIGQESSTAGVTWQQYANGYAYWTAATGAHSVAGAIWGVYMDAGGPAALGAPTTDESSTPDGVGRFNHFAGGASVYWTPGTGAQVVKGLIRDLWQRTGWETGPLGYPTSGEMAAPSGGLYQTYQQGTVYFTPAGGAVEVHGSIAARWQALGGLDWAVPTSSQKTAASGVVVNTFSGDRSIYATPAGGAWVVQGQIRDAWLALGGPTGALGMVTSDEQGGSDGVRYSTFGKGSVYWTPATGAHAVQNAIARKWTALGALGWGQGVPTTNESRTPDGVGRYNHFSGGASIYWTSTTGAHAVQGQIRDLWASLGWERGALGYPTSDEQATADGTGRQNTFTNGAVFWTPAGGAHAVVGAIYDRYSQLGGVRSTLGYPTSNEVAVTGGRASTFQHGTLTWNAKTGTVTVTYT